jgi:proteasome lid subunit RPN8/RPN11
MADGSLCFTRSLWFDCMDQLHRRGRERHESGCFVLGTVDGARRRATRCVYYDELDARAYESGVCVLHGGAFSKLWEICRGDGLAVVADIHTHGREAFQSTADRRNPMIARSGHIAVIVPNFARAPVWRHNLGLYRYEGDHRWDDLSGWRARAFIKVPWSIR